MTFSQGNARRLAATNKSAGRVNVLSMKRFDERLQRLQVFAGLKPHGLSGRNIHFRTCSRIAADPGLAGFDREDAKAAQLNPIVSFQRVFHAIEDGVDGLFSLRFADARSLNDLIDKIEFDH
jgi:hypothetical protein